MSPVNQTIERWARQSPGKVALHFQGEDLTYASLLKKINATKLPVARGERIAYLGYNSPEMLVLLFAAARQGAILVPLNWRLTAAEYREILADCSPRFLYVGKGFEGHGLGIPRGEFTDRSKD